jgi:hypothetical protein
MSLQDKQADPSIRPVMLGTPETCASSKKTHTNRQNSAAGYIKHNDLHKWATMESSVARLLRVAVSISHPSGLHERFLRDFSFAD